MPDTPIRWGILGAGNIAHKFADAVAQDPDSMLVSVASNTPGKAAAFAEAVGISADESYQSLVGRDDIDVVYIATTHNFHTDNAALALNHGKSVLIEKPFTVNAPQAQFLVDLARDKGLFLMEAIWTRFLPTMIELKKRLNEQVIGEVQHMNLTFGGFAPDKYRPRLIDPALAGGVTLDMGIYPISFVCYLAGELPVQVQSLCQFSDTGVDERATYQFRFASGMTASIATSYNLKMKQEAVLYGTTGYIDYPDFQSGSAFAIHHHGGTNDVDDSAAVQLDQADNGFVYQVAEVVRCLRAGERESPLIPHTETVAIMALMDDMRQQWGLRYPFE
ncbi:Gfo/Idh/MocA family protein [Saccharospirillum impatiens]|uniref:Gfo/Idh/MocA family protein n=1 Tax=Saccharospirillum impatiens TaxID=169438 RepID=UPI0003FEF5F6|nr:Gfo/Idh/MocA family oxidoreductase [Saccharospirillum impatiens]